MKLCSKEKHTIHEPVIQSSTSSIIRPFLVLLPPPPSLSPCHVLSPARPASMCPLAHAIYPIATIPHVRSSGLEALLSFRLSFPLP